MRNYIVIMLAGLMLSSCGVYKKYKSQADAPVDLYGTGDTIAQ